MNISKEEAIQELSRRGIDVSELQRNEKSMFGKIAHDLTHFPKIPEGYANSPELRSHMEELTNLAAGGPGMQVAGRVAKAGKELGKKAYDYVSPSKISSEMERFKNETLGSGSESENIANLSKRVQLAEKSGKAEALPLKESLYSKEGKSKLFDEGMAGVSERTPAKGNDIPMLATPNESKYFANKNIAKYFDTDLKSVHNNFKKNPTLENYDELQSQLKTEMRALKGEGKMNREARREYKSFKSAVDDLNHDKELFVKTLPKEMQNLETEFRTKWATGPAKYGSEAKLTLQRLASGKPGDLGQVTDQAIVKLFTNPNKNTLDAIKELGPSVGRNVIYSALNKIKPGEARKMADAILDLKRKKGFESFITPDIEKWAMEMSKRTKRSELAKKAASIGGGALAGSTLGPFGTVAGGLVGAAPYIKEFLMRSPKRM